MSIRRERGPAASSHLRARGGPGVGPRGALRESPRNATAHGVCYGRLVEAVADSSFVISLARSGLLGLIPRLPFDLVWLDVIKREAVDAGTAGGHVDATAIETATSAFTVRSTARWAGHSVDTVVVEAAAKVGLLISNDRALGRRARNLGAHWLRTADVVVLLQERRTIDAVEARAAIVALRDAKRISEGLADTYLDQIGDA